MIAVVDYKKGNLLSVERGLRAAGVDGLHVYTMNKPAVARAICELL